MPGETARAMNNLEGTSGCVSWNSLQVTGSSEVPVFAGGS